MGGKYSTNTTSGYNSSPPADDGSATEANKVKWSTIKTKLADPVKDRADLINTDLVEHFDQGPDTHSTNYTTVASDYNTVLEVSGTTTISLGDASTLGAGYFVLITNVGTGAVTVAVDTAGDTLLGTANGTITLGIQQTMTFIVNAAANGYMGVGGLAGQEFILQSNDAGATSGPDFYLYRNSASPAINDTIGKILFDGQDDAGNRETFAQIASVITDETSGSENGYITLQTKEGGTLASRLIIGGTGGGVWTLNATGGDQGADSINAKSFHVDGRGSTVYGGRAGSGATITGPTGWTIARPSTGYYQITHSLGHTNYSVVCQAFDNPHVAYTEIIGTNAVDIIIVNESDAVENTQFDFILVDFN